MEAEQKGVRDNANREPEHGFCSIWFVVDKITQSLPTFPLHFHVEQAFQIGEVLGALVIELFGGFELQFPSCLARRV